MPRPLLPLIEGGQEWDALNKKPGLNPEQKKDFPDRLYKYGTIEASGVPSLFNHPFGIYTKLNAGVGETFKKFSTLIKGIFLGVISLENITDNLGQLMEVAKRVKPDFNNFVVLNWKGQPIGGIYPDCLVFPGAKFEAGEYEKDISWNGLQDELQKKENQLGSDIVRALFTEWIDEIASILKLPAGVDGPLWFQMLSRISTEWASQIQPPPTALNDFTTVISEVHLTLNNKLGAIPIRTVTKNIFCEKIIKFVSGKTPDLPVKSEFLSLVAAVNKSGDTYQVTLKNWKGTTNWTPQEIVEGDRASILLWPNFKAKDWNVNYALFYPSAKLSGLKPSLTLINFDSQRISCITKIKEEPGLAAGCVTNQEINYIEVFCGDTSVGTFEDKRQNINVGAGNRRISLDFGTVHTSIAVWDGAENNILSIQDMTIDILDMNFYDQNEFKRFPVWLPTFEREIRVFPSELTFTSYDMMQPANLLLGYIQCFTAPSYTCAAGIETTIEGFKWKEPPIFEGHRDDLVKAYLKMIMHMALANLRRLHNAQNVSVVATFPLAFDKQKYEDYKIWVEQLINHLALETGVGITLAVTTLDGRKILVGESYAAKALYNPPSPTAEFVVDIGGGTTDIALLIGNNILAVDSFRYGGNLFIEHIAKNMFPQANNPAIAFINNHKGNALALLKAMRILGSIRGLFAEFGDDRARAEAALYRFFNGLFEYLRMLLYANNLKDNIFLYLIGNGWRLIDGFSNVPNISSFVVEWFKQREINLTAIPADGVGWKEALAIGANSLIEQNAYNPPADFLDNPVKSSIGGKVRITWDGGSKEFDMSTFIPTPGLGFTMMNNPGFDTKEFIESLPFEPLSDTPSHVIAAQLNAECRRGDMWGISGGGLSLKRSIFARFLEAIYPRHYLGTGG